MSDEEQQRRYPHLTDTQHRIIGRAVDSQHVFERELKLVVAPPFVKKLETIDPYDSAWDECTPWLADRRATLYSIRGGR
jgi:hypothetical protein